MDKNGAKFNIDGITLLDEITPENNTHFQHGFFHGIRKITFPRINSVNFAGLYRVWKFDYVGFQEIWNLVGIMISCGAFTELEDGAGIQVWFVVILGKWWILFGLERGCIGIAKLIGDSVGVVEAVRM